VEVRADGERFGGYGAYLVFQPAERSSTFRIRALVGAGEDLVLGLGEGGRAHWGGMGRWRGEWRRVRGHYISAGAGVALGWTSQAWNEGRISPRGIFRRSRRQRIMRRNPEQGGRV
jgi:hypothetical protein